MKTAAAGPDWQPPVIFLQTNDTRRVRQHHLFAHSTVRFGNRVTAFEIPQHLLARELPITGTAKDDQDYDRLDHVFPVAIRRIVDIRSSYLSIAGQIVHRRIGRAIGDIVQPLARDCFWRRTSSTSSAGSAGMR